MILTKRFVYIHLPKTGGTFVTKVLERLMKPAPPRNFLERLARKVRGRAYRDTNKHGVMDEIPPSHRGLPVFTTVRNPYDRYVSQYAFSWWRNQPRSWAEKKGLLAKFPNFPEITFEEFIEDATTSFHRFRNSPLPPGDGLGAQSEQFVRYFFRDPEPTWGRIDDAYIAARGWEKDLLPVRFLRQESLNRDLHDFLRENGFAEPEVAFILEEGRILPSGPKRDHSRHWEESYTPALKATVRRRERLLFAMFPEYDG